MMDTKTIIETAEEKLIHTYNRYQIVLDKGYIKELQTVWFV